MAPCAVPYGFKILPMLTLLAFEHLPTYAVEVAISADSSLSTHVASVTGGHMRREKGSSDHKRKHNHTVGGRLTEDQEEAKKAEEAPAEEMQLIGDGVCGIGGKDVAGRMYSEGPGANVGWDRCKELCARSEWCQASTGPGSSSGMCLLMPYTYEDSPCNGKKHDGTHYNDIPGLDGISWNMNQCQKEYKPVDSVFKADYLAGWRCYLKQKATTTTTTTTAAWTKTDGICRGGQRWPNGKLGDCIWKTRGKITLQECKDACATETDCAAFETSLTPTSSSTDKGKCCLFKEGNSGNGKNRRKWCYLKPVAA